MTTDADTWDRMQREHGPNTPEENAMADLYLEYQAALFNAQNETERQYYRARLNELLGKKVY